MLKSLGKAIVKTVAVTAKFCIFAYMANELAYLDREVHQLRREADKLKANAKG